MMNKTQKRGNRETEDLKKLRKNMEKTMPWRIPEPVLCQFLRSKKAGKLEFDRSSRKLGGTDGWSGRHLRKEGREGG